MRSIRVRELQAEQRKKNLQEHEESARRHLMTKEFVLTTLRDILDRCMGEPFDATGACRAVESIGKELGMFVTRVELGRAGEFARLSKLSEEELDAELAQSIEAAQKLISKVRSDSAAS